MEQQNIREYNGQTFTIEEAAAWLLELNRRTKSSQNGRNSIDELASGLFNKVDKIEGKGLSKHDFTDFLKSIVQLYQATLTEDSIGSGGSHHNINCNCGTIRFVHENAQAVVTGFVAPTINGLANNKAGKLLFIKNDGTQSIRFESDNNNSLVSNRLILPGQLDAMEIKPGGHTIWKYSPSLQRWEVANEWGSGLMPSLIDEESQEDAAVLVTPLGFLKRTPLKDLTTFNDTKSVDYANSTEINADYPDKAKGEFVFVSQTNQFLIKKDNAPGNWGAIPINTLNFS
jgi:hypothetical protein